MYAFSINSDNALYEEDDERGDDHTTTFSKKKVLTTEECRLSGVFNSALNVAAIESRVSSITGSPNRFYSAANGDCDPCDSLIMQAFVSVKIPEELSREPQKLLLPSVEDANALADASISWYRWLVILFAGRKANTLA